MTPVDLVASEDAETVRRNVDRRLAGEVDALEYRFAFERSDGEHRPVRAHGTRVEVDGEPAILGTVISEGLTDERT